MDVVVLFLFGKVEEMSIVCGGVVGFEKIKLECSRWKDFVKVEFGWFMR